jgi:Tol biopolymer transport system component
MDKEMVDGDLKAAIEMYKRIVANPGGNRAVAAKALLQLGRCYEKLGNSESRKAYERLVRDYADQAEQVQIAHGRLAALAETRSRTAGSETAVRKVWSGPEVDFEGEVSPDGKYISFVDWDTGDLAIHDLETGTKRRLTNKGPWKESEAYAYTSRWAPDGKQIAYEWYDGHGWDLRLVSTDNAKSRVLYKSSQWEIVTPCDWSSDGKYILAYESKQYQRSEGNIVLISVDDGTARVLKTLHRSYEGSPRLSPDGRYVALDLPQRESGAEHDIFVFSVDGGREAALVSHPAHDWVLDWSPDGNWLLFASDRSGTLGIWAIRIVDGAAKGDPQIVKAGLPDILPMGLTRRGTFCYGQSSRNENVYVAKLDPRTGKVAGRPEEVTQRFEGLCAGPAFSPDGKYLAYACSRAPIYGYSGRNILRIRSLETGQDRELSTEFSSIHYPRWLPDGRFMLITGIDDSGMGIYKLDTQTWAMKLLLRDARVNLLGNEPSPAGKGFFYARREKQKDLCRILFRDFEKGDEKELYRGPVAESFAVSLSPDGRLLAFLNRTNPRVLRVIPADGGEPRELFRFEGVGDANIGMAWTPDGKYILFSKPLDQEAGKWDLWRVPVDGGEAQMLGSGMRCDDPSMHPDGQHIAFSSISGTSFSEVWVMENFLPPVARTPAR